MSLAVIGAVAAVAAVGASAYSAVSSSNAASDAQASQEAAASNANATQQQQFNTQQANNRPWQQAGTGAINQLAAGTQPGGQFSTVPQFNFDQSKIQQDPGYAFRMQQGVNALTAAGAAAGNLGSGNLGTALTNYGQQAGSQEYQAAYGRAYQQQQDQYNSQLTGQNTLFNRLSGIAGTGQVANSQLASAGQNYANQTGNNLMTSAANIGNIGINQAANQNNMIQNGLQTGINGLAAYRQNQLYQNYQNNVALYNNAGGNINNVDFGSFGDTSSMGGY